MKQDNPAADYLFGKCLELYDGLNKRVESQTQQLTVLSQAMADLARATQSANDATKAALQDVAGAINDIVSGRVPIRRIPDAKADAEIVSDTAMVERRENARVLSTSPDDAPSAEILEKAVNEADLRTAVPPQHQTHFSAANRVGPRSESVARLMHRIQTSQQLRQYDISRRYRDGDALVESFESEEE